MYEGFVCSTDRIDTGVRVSPFMPCRLYPEGKDCEQGTHLLEGAGMNMREHGIAGTEEVNHPAF